MAGHHGSEEDGDKLCVGIILVGQSAKAKAEVLNAMPLVHIGQNMKKKSLMITRNTKKSWLPSKTGTSMLRLPWAEGDGNAKQNKVKTAGITI